MMDDFPGIEITAELSLHDQTVQQDVFQAGRFIAVCWIGMIIRRCHQNVAVLPDFDAALPVGIFLFPSAKHSVCLAFHSLAKTRIP